MRFLVLLATACLALTAVVAEEKRIVCYFGSWSVYREGAGKFSIGNIDPKLCTHLIYTFVGLSGNQVKVLDAWQDLPDGGGKDGYRHFNALRKLSPSTKTLVAIGGWNEGSENYSKMASSPSSRSEFVRSVVEFVKKHEFDGFDVDWEYPAQRGGAAADVNNFVALLKEMRAAFDREGLLLTVAVGAAKPSASQSYNIPEVTKHVDFINLMTYDLHGVWDQMTGMNAPLFPGASETAAFKQMTADAAVKYWLSQGADPKKLVLGIATYGRTFTLANPAANGVGARITGLGVAGPYTKEPGMYGYNEICEIQNKEQWTVVFDEERRTPYAYRGNQWVGYDNVKSVKEKAEYVKKMGLGGAMVWSIETDDFLGKCGESFPLVKTLNHVLRGGPPVSDVPPRASKKSPTPANQKPIHSHAASQPSPATSINTSGECKAPGNMPDPSTCEQFFQCVPSSDNTYVKWSMRCPAGLCYKAESGVCDWK